eukprot:1153442-Pelagomonas_calceolata.AAC.1
MLCSFVLVSLCVLFGGLLHVYSLTLPLHTEHFWTSQALFTFHVLQKQTNELEQLSRLSSRTTWPKVKFHCNLVTYLTHPPCWTAQVLDGLQGLRRCNSFVQAVRQGTPIPIQKFTDDLRHRFWAVWRDVEGVNPRDTYCKLATYHSFCSAF